MNLTVIGFPETIAAIRRYGRDGVAATNKPVTLRWALARIERALPRLTPFAEAEAELRPLLDELARPGTLASHAYWRLKHDLGGYWEVVYDGPGGEGRKEPPLAALREHAAAGFTKDVHAKLVGDPELRRRTAALLDRLIETDRDSGSPATTPGPLERRSVERIVRSVGFRSDVLAAYERRCSVCGYAGRLRSRAVGLEAAHVRGLAQGGQESIDNGVVMCSLHHSLFDAGAFTFGGDRGLVVSPAFTADDGAPALEPYAGQLLPEPSNGAWRIHSTNLAWHRRNVFVAAGPYSSRS